MPESFGLENEGQSPTQVPACPVRVVSRGNLRGLERRARAWVVCFGYLLVLLSQTVTPAHAVETDRKLPELPRAPSLELKPPKPDDLAELDALLARIRDKDAATRDTAVREILELPPRLVPAIRYRLEKLSSENKAAMKQVLFETRRKARDLSRDEEDGSKKTPDYLAMLSEHGPSSEKGWQTLIQVVALSRMLEQIGTVEAVRGLVDVYARYGEFLRVDTQLALARLGDRAVPALIEARRHQAEKIGKWAKRQLDALGKAAPSEAVQIPDLQVLADALRAYGRTRDLDAARIVISFAGSERTQIREAARQGIGLLGETGHWQLREAYEGVVGKRAARDWTWERTARELFAELDRTRRAEAFELFDAGLKAQAAGDLETMRTSFDKVLARSPTFERADEMVGGYWDYGKRHADDKRDVALDALSRALRLSKEGASRQRIESLYLTIEAARREAAGVADRNLLKRALELDPDNERARASLAAWSTGAPIEDRRIRYGIASGIGVLGLLGILLLLRKPRSTPEPEPTPPPSGAADPEPTPPPSDPSDPEPTPPPSGTSQLEPAPSPSDEPAPEPTPPPRDEPAPEPTAPPGEASTSEAPRLDEAPATPGAESQDSERDEASSPGTRSLRR
jgi:hypothetical protein